MRLCLDEDDYIRIGRPQQLLTTNDVFLSINQLGHYYSTKKTQETVRKDNLGIFRLILKPSISFLFHAPLPDGHGLITSKGPKYTFLMSYGYIVYTEGRAL